MVTAAGSAALLILIAATAWMCDDAYITLRSVDNLVSGFGPRWNVQERVQAFTHPAWFALLVPIYAVTREAFYTVLCLQMVLATLTVGLVCHRLARSAPEAGLAVAAFAASKAFVDFSTAGLENPLVHLAIVLFVIAWRHARASAAASLLPLGALTALLLLCRLDLAVLVAPMVAGAVWRAPRRRWQLFAAGLIPLVAWEFFSLAYYGQLVPNTALAKLPAGVTATELLAQGGRYFLGTFHFDPMTLVVLAGAMAALVASGSRGRFVAAGIGLHLTYVAAAGGDFMSGRFLTPSFVLATAGVLAFPAWPQGRWPALALSGALVLGGLLNPLAPLRTAFLPAMADGQAEFSDRFGVTDERQFYAPALGLVNVWRDGVSPDAHPWAAFGRRVRAESRDVVVASNIGLFGYYAGPSVYIIDRNALADPFLSRLPPQPGWRPGHFTRAVPDGYVESRRQRANLLETPALRQLFDDVCVITQSPVWDGARWRLIVRPMPRASGAAGGPVR